MIMATQSALAADADLLSDDERAQIDTLIRSLADARAQGDAATVEAATQLLAKGTEAFAAQRMNRGIRQALAGKNIEAV
jgi:molecular chaperone HscA